MPLGNDYAPRLLDRAIARVGERWTLLILATASWAYDGSRLPGAPGHLEGQDLGAAWSLTGC